MKFSPTALPGVIAITSARAADERGSFGRVFCEREFAAAGLPARFVQWSLSESTRAGTLRGMHWQAAPHGEAKLVRCMRGAVHDVVADLRPDSPGFGRWEAFRLEAHGGAMLFIPPGCAHGFQALQDDTAVLYAMDEFFAPAHGSGFRYDDPAFGVQWPLPVARISPKDLEWPPFKPHAGGAGVR